MPVEEATPSTLNASVAAQTNEPDPTAATTATDVVTAPAHAAPLRTPPPILPDDTRPKVRAEDFLPFFQFPGSAAAGDVTVVVPTTPGGVPAPATQPRSSATYRQQ